MLHILLFILKIIGIIIAAILGILVLLVCVVLFVPGRYDIEASCDGSISGIRAAARMTWFLNLIRLNVCYEKKEMTWRLRIAWKNRQSGQENKKKIKKEVETHDKEAKELWKDFEEGVEEEAEKGICKELEEHEKVVGTLEETKESGKFKQISEETGESKGQINEKNKSSEEVPDESKESNGESQKSSEKISEGGESLEEKANDCKNLEEAETGAGEWLEEDERGSEKERKRIWQKIADSCQEIIRKITDLYRKITEIPGKTGEILQRFSDRIKTLSEKKNKIIDFITDEVHKKAFVKIKDEGLYLLKKLKPKKFLAKIHFGFEDPCMTGKLLAGVSMLYPFLGKDVEVSPDFERQVLEGNLKIIGRIRVSCFARLLWKLIWCKEVRMTYKHVRSFEL